MARRQHNPLGADAADVAAGRDLFRQNCEICHGYDGSGRTRIGGGEYPRPPVLRSLIASMTDWMADTTGLGYEGGALVFAAGLVLIAWGYFYTNVSRTLLFWSAFILTRPLGATVGDLLDKPLAEGGLAFSRYYASAMLAVLIVALIVVLPQRAGGHPGAHEGRGVNAKTPEVLGRAAHQPISCKPKKRWKRKRFI